LTRKKTCIFSVTMSGSDHTSLREVKKKGIPESEEEKNEETVK